MSIMRIGQQAPRNTVLFSGFLNYFSTMKNNDKVGFALISIKDGIKPCGRANWRTVSLETYGQATPFFKRIYDEMQANKAKGIKAPRLIQSYSATLSSYEKNNETFTFLKVFKAHELNTSRIIINSTTPKKIGTKAQNDVIISSGALRNFSAIDEHSGWVYYSVHDGFNTDGSKRWRSISTKVFGQTKNMIEKLHNELKIERENKRRANKTIQIYSGILSSYNKNEMNKTFLKAFKANVIDKINDKYYIVDNSESQKWAA